MDDHLFRSAMGKFATGVTVILTETDGKTHGMTANAFMSVSLDPKLVVISIKENARMLSKIHEAKMFSVNILNSKQEEISKIFAGQIKDQEVTFDRLMDVPVIPGAIAQVVCEVSAEHVEGDHTLFIGKITNISIEDGDPLLFFNGKYRSLEELVKV
ncbi:flavin reductase (DIM6/NTAB) family NADH-FMN oxidoreductase RutF [Bacillus niacini]|uniref:Flavin reductase (DIM6/NTAB) family NADH-FMN oxidoreductase RutF n=1 Tax=Neobacillus niacini TaxID=86668 RepID=A0A852TLF5_9BACI|nr:flavin reductase family protein [Neobacillus niacini]NYE09592.1 flavin reductase (DIM6/NTAB) family NADH-FMN oxidoreductase RutF [Neobacillus niacini]